jgi:hypothetical protein
MVRSNGRDSLTLEGTVIGRYLLGVDPPEILIDRYRRANESLFGDPVPDEDRIVLDFVHAHPWSLSLLDSGLGLVRPRSRLRKKMVVMLAILETTPRFAADFEPCAAGRVGTIARLIGHAAVAAARVVAGLVLYGAFVRWRR